MKKAALMTAGLALVASVSVAATAQDSARGDQSAPQQSDQGRGQDSRDGGRGGQGGQGDQRDQRDRGAYGRDQGGQGDQRNGGYGRDQGDQRNGGHGRDGGGDYRGGAGRSGYGDGRDRGVAVSRYHGHCRIVIRHHRRIRVCR